MVYTYTKRCKITAKTIKLSAFFSSPPNVNFQRRLLNNVGKSYDSWDLCLLWPAVVHLKIDWSIRKCPWFQQSTFLNFAIYWHSKGPSHVAKKYFFFDNKNPQVLMKGIHNFSGFPWGVSFLFLAEFSRLQCAQSSQSSM